MRSAALLGLSVALGVALGVASGCGSSGGTGERPDAGDDASTPDMLRRRDAQVTGEDPIQACRRFDPLACPAGEQCKVLIRRAAGEADFAIYEGCVEPRGERGLGAPCDPFGGLVDPYRVEGLVDEVYLDPCAEGLFCTADPDVRGLSTCRPACATTAVSGYAQLCSGAAEYCTGSGPYQEACRKSDGCDPTDPASCGVGRGCYLRFGGDGMSVLSVCLQVPTDPLADGEVCVFINDCLPGSHCWGPVTVPPSLWSDAELLCRRGCVPGAGSGSGADAGDEDDAGTPDADGCGAGQQCVDFAASGLDIESISASFGHCE